MRGRPTRSCDRPARKHIAPSLRCTDPRGAMSCGSPMPRGEQIAKPAERGTRLAGPFFSASHGLEHLALDSPSGSATIAISFSPVTHVDTAEILMSASTAAMTSSTTTRGLWEGLWRKSGINFVAFAIIAYVIYGYQPQVGAPADALVAFYGGHRTRILIAAAFSGLNVLNLLWFAAALRTTLADAGQDGWGAAATAYSTAVGALFLLFLTVSAALAFSIAGSGNHTLTAGLNDFEWVLVVLSSFPRAMLIMAGSFGLWRAGLISNALL